MDFPGQLLEIALTNAGSAAVLALVAAVAQQWLRRPAIVRGLWLLVLIKLMTPPIYKLSVPLPGPMAPATSAPLATVLATNSAAFNTPIAIGPTAPVLTTETVMLALWLFGTLFVAVLALIRTVRFQRTLAQSEPADALLQSRIDALAATMGLARSPRAALVDRAISPMLWAAPRSLRLIVPKALLNLLSTREVDTLCAHELAHLRRGDHWVRYLELVATVLFWWHPATWWACQQSRRAEEECCDALVARTLPEHRRAYADCLLKTMKYLAGAGRAPYALDRGGLATGAGEVRDLQRRLTMIMTQRPPSSLSTLSRSILTLAALGLLAVFPTIAQGDGSAPVTQVNPRFSGEAIDFNANAAPLGDVLRDLASKTGLNIAIEPSVDLTSPVTTSFVGIPWDQVLSTVINNQGLSYSIEGKLVWISGGGGSLTESGQIFQGDPISLSLQDADLRDTLRKFSEQSGFRLDIEPGIEGQVTVELKDVPWDQAFDAILRINSLRYTIEDRTVKVRPKSRRSRPGPVP